MGQIGIVLQFRLIRSVKFQIVIFCIKKNKATNLLHLTH
jgi:hypothetical protein